MKTYKRLMAENLKTICEYPSKFHISSPQKISTISKNSFSLPAGPEYSCPGATKACAGCYASKGRHYFPCVQKALGNNWKLVRKLQRNKAPDKIVNMLLDSIPDKAPIFRIHESGDFYNQWYLEAWARVVRARKDTRFWAYTRSFHLDFANLTRNPNFTLWASTDDYNIDKAKAFVRRFKKSGTKLAYGPWSHDRDLPDNSIICPATNNKLDLNGACEKCMLCVVKKRISKNIIFLEH